MEEWKDVIHARNRWHYVILVMKTLKEFYKSDKGKNKTKLKSKLNLLEIFVENCGL